MKKFLAVTLLAAACATAAHAAPIPCKNVMVDTVQFEMAAGTYRLYLSNRTGATVTADVTVGGFPSGVTLQNGGRFLNQALMSGDSKFIRFAAGKVKIDDSQVRHFSDTLGSGSTPWVAVTNCRNNK